MKLELLSWTTLVEQPVVANVVDVAPERILVVREKRWLRKPRRRAWRGRVTVWYDNETGARAGRYVESELNRFTTLIEWSRLDALRVDSETKAPPPTPLGPPEFVHWMAGGQPLTACSQFTLEEYTMKPFKYETSLWEQVDCPLCVKSDLFPWRRSQTARG